MRHFQRREYVFCGEVAQRLAANPLHNRRKQEESGVAVQPFAARSKIQRFLPCDQRQSIRVRGHAVDGDARQFHQCQIVPEPTGVIQQLHNSDFSPIIRQFRDVLAYVVIYGKLALLFEQQDARGRELLRGRANVKHRLRRDRYIFFDVRQSIALRVDYLPIAINA